MFGSKVNYVYPQHKALTEHKINAFKTSMENAGDIRAFGIVQLGNEHFLLEMLPA